MAALTISHTISTMEPVFLEAKNMNKEQTVRLDGCFITHAQASVISRASNFLSRSVHYLQNLRDFD